MSLSKTVSAQAYRKEISPQDLQDHAWVDDWLPNQSALRQQWTALEWKGRFVKLSKTLSYMLRFGAQENGLTLRPDAYISVATLLAHGQFKKFGYTMEEVGIAVQMNAKERFAVKEEGEECFIRAQQGHGSRVGRIDQRAVNTVLAISDVPDLVLHGTVWAKVQAILTEGLKIMGRDHIHMATGFLGDGQVTSGVRRESDTFLKINARRAISDGIEFFRSGNGVILTAGCDGVLAPMYIECVMNRHGVRQLTPSAWTPPIQEVAPLRELVPNAPTPSQLNVNEKNFLKESKKVRAILKIAEQKAAGHIDPMQENKLAKLNEALSALAAAEKELNNNSDLREKNKDVLAALHAMSEEMHLYCTHSLSSPYLPMA